MLLSRLAEPLAEAGLQRVNISIDTLNPPVILEMDNAEDHTSREHHQADSDDSHCYQRDGNDLLKEERILWHVRFAFHVDLVCHDHLAIFLLVILSQNYPNQQDEFVQDLIKFL